MVYPLDVTTPRDSYALIYRELATPHALSESFIFILTFLYYKDILTSANNWEGDLSGIFANFFRVQKMHCQ